MTEPTHDESKAMSDNDIACGLVFYAGFGLMEIVEDMYNHFGGRQWRPPKDISAMVSEVDSMIGPLSTGTLRARELIIRSENPSDPDLEAFRDFDKP